ncbi:MAG TPA: GNAT family N-acetyltransferase [Spirochaetia bacterium]|nr:GNAT family N-acetyltransferase [Spirochaetia bacterium]HRZ65593.1 GNAT family N-acetyltransferase [Spirochaetia bacterium]
MEGRGEIEIGSFGIEDYEAALELWKRTPGMGLSSADERGPLGAFLERNPRLSFAARSGGLLVGTVLCGTDGRRGFLYHLAVDPEFRRRGLGSELAAASLAALKARGIDKCHLFVLAGNGAGAAFWAKAGWTLREDILTFSKNT